MNAKQDEKEGILPVIILNARPGAGKSEIIKFLTDLSPFERKKRFHVGKIHIIDDFPFLWRWFEEDYLLEQMGHEHLFSDSEGYFKEIYLWDLLIHLINLEYTKYLRDITGREEYTIIIEFSRGSQHGGYKRAYPLLSNEILLDASLLYVDVPWEESLRKNRARFNPDKPDSILEHGIPDKKLEFMYSKCDFDEVPKTAEDFILINEHEIPFSIFNNIDDVTTNPGSELEDRLENAMNSLWKKRISS